MSTLSTSSTQQNQSRDRAIDPARRDRYRGLLAGMLGALVMVAVFILFRPFTGSVSVLDTLADATLLAMPIGLFSYLLETFGTNAKTLFLIGLIAVLVLIGGGIGQLYAARTAGARRPIWSKAQAYAIGFALVLGLFLLAVAGWQTPDAVRGMKAVRALAVVALGAEAWAIVTAVMLAMLRSRAGHPGAASRAETPGGTIDRRRALSIAGLAAVSIGAVAVVGREVQRVATRKTVGEASAGTIPPAITPNDDFYVISKNIFGFSPERGGDWQIEVDGLVDRPSAITRTELEEMAAVEDFVSTLTCISNEIGGELIGTARWTGVPLSAVLERFGVGANVVDVVGEGEDGYSDSIPIDKALAPETHVVWAMNGEPLAQDHGTPVRLIVPGLYGIKNVKWLTKLTLTADDYQGYWQDRDWTDSAIIKTQSHFDVPDSRDVLPAGTIEIGGVAFAGDRGISKVEVSVDDGDSWQEATIAENPSPAGLSWVVWTMDWNARPGSYTLVVRATDGEGNLQTAETAPTLPDGASGYHHINVGVA